MFQIKLERIFSEEEVGDEGGKIITRIFSEGSMSY